MNNVTYILIMLLCLTLSAFFSASETSYLSLNRTKLKTLAEKGNKRAALACKLDEKYDKLISTILIGNNIVNILMASIGTILFVKHFGDIGATISTVVVTIVVLIFGEISPKSIAKDCADQFAMFAAPMLQLLIIIFTPINVLFSAWKSLLGKLFNLQRDDKMSQEELLMMVEEVQQDGSIDEDESGLLKNAIEFSEQEARDILIHRMDLAALPIDSTMEEIADMFTETKFSRILIYEDTIDNVIGTLHRKDFYEGCGITKKPLSEIITPAMFVLETEPIRQLLKKLQKAKTHVAVVIDEYGGTCGIVTMEDILEELVGDILDEHDEEEVLLRRIAPDTFVIDAGMNYDDFADYFHLKETSDRVAVSGWVMEKLEHMPETGEQFDCEHITVTVTKIENRRVTEVKVVSHEETDEETSDCESDSKQHSVDK